MNEWEYPCSTYHKYRSDKPGQHVTFKQLQNIQYAWWWWWWWRDVRKKKMKLMLVSFPSPKCNHNKLPLWGTDTFDLYFFMIHVCIYCCAVAHMDNPVPHVWISLNNKDALTAVLSDFFKLLLSVCTVFVSLAFFDTLKYSHTRTDGQIDRQTDRHLHKKAESC